MAPDEPLHQTPTHSVTEVKVSALGLQTSRFKWVIIATLAGLPPAAMTAPVLGLPLAVGIMFSPALFVGVVHLMLQNRPPGWFMQWLETKLTGAHLTPLHSRRSCLEE